MRKVHRTDVQSLALSLSFADLFFLISLAHLLFFNFKCERSSSVCARYEPCESCIQSSLVTPDFSLLSVHSISSRFCYELRIGSSCTSSFVRDLVFYHVADFEIKICLLYVISLQRLKV